jgi:hypothetical protein
LLGGLPNPIENRGSLANGLVKGLRRVIAFHDRHNPVRVRNDKQAKAGFLDLLEQDVAEVRAYPEQGLHFKQQSFDPLNVFAVMWSTT